MAKFRLGHAYFGIDAEGDKWSSFGIAMLEATEVPSRIKYLFELKQNGTVESTEDTSVIILQEEAEPYGDVIVICHLPDVDGVVPIMIRPPYHPDLPCIETDKLMLRILSEIPMGVLPVQWESDAYQAAKNALVGTGMVAGTVPYEKVDHDSDKLLDLDYLYDVLITAFNGFPTSLESIDLVEENKKQP